MEQRKTFPVWNTESRVSQKKTQSMQQCSKNNLCEEIKIKICHAVKPCQTVVNQIFRMMNWHVIQGMMRLTSPPRSVIGCPSRQIMERHPVCNQVRKEQHVNLCHVEKGQQITEIEAEDGSRVMIWGCCVIIWGWWIGMYRTRQS